MQAGYSQLEGCLEQHISRKAMKEIKGKNVLEGRVPSKETKDEATGKDKKKLTY